MTKGQLFVAGGHALTPVTYLLGRATITGRWDWMSFLWAAGLSALLAPAFLASEKQGAERRRREATARAARDHLLDDYAAGRRRLDGR